MTVTTVDELLGRDRRSDDVALVDATGREYDRHWLSTSSLQAGNFLRHMGVGDGVTVGVVGTGPLAVVASFGTTLLGGQTWFEPPTQLADSDVRTVVAPIEPLEDDTYDLPPGAQRVAYGEKPTVPGIHHFEAGLWTENPSFPPRSIDPQLSVVTDGEATYSHEAVLSTAQTVIADAGIDEGDVVSVEAALSRPAVFVAGLVAPLLAEAVIALPGADTDPSLEVDVAVTAGETPHNRIDPTDIAIDSLTS